MKIKKRFTYIEMLIVVAVIMILFSILIHCFTRALEIARKTYCINNLRQAATVAGIYNVDHGRLPYSSNWLIDFSFLTKYLQSYDIMICPETEDDVASEADLIGNTSYHYMGTRYDWLANNESNGDGSEYGFDASNPSIVNQLSSREEQVMYDKTDNIHYGHFNVVFLDSSHAETVHTYKRYDYWRFNASGNLNFLTDDTCDGGGDEDGDTVTLWHIPPGNPAAAHVIHVGAAAVPAHLAHGDHVMD